jgi:hypothetical protein
MSRGFHCLYLLSSEWDLVPVIQQHVRQCLAFLNINNSILLWERTMGRNWKSTDLPRRKKFRPNCSGPILFSGPLATRSTSLWMYQSEFKKMTIIQLWDFYLLYCTAQCSTVQCSAVQCSAAKCAIYLHNLHCPARSHNMPAIRDGILGLKFDKGLETFAPCYLKSLLLTDLTENHTLLWFLKFMQKNPRNKKTRESIHDSIL